MAGRTSSARLTPGGPALRRYSRHLLIPEVGLAGQERLASARVLVVGAGGLGCPALQYLAAAGVGRIGIVDDDTVELTNLQRQTLFTTDDVGRGKAQVAAERVQALNPLVAVDVFSIRLDAANARDLVRPYDVVLDCTDRFAARYAINDACVLEDRPDVFAAIYRFDGQVSVFRRGGPCYRCLFPVPPPRGAVPTCAEGGVLGALAGIVGAWQAAEALKLVLGIGESAAGRLILIDALAGRVREVRLAADPACALCGSHATVHDVLAVETGDDDEPFDDDVTAEELDAVLREAVLLDVREPYEAVLGVPEGAVHIPASMLEARMHELDSARTYVVACRVGVRSRWAVERLRQAGFRRVRHLRGGLAAYAARHEEFAFF
jgi:molybdopterin/thiamine biosynthesis adenylyltransferase/rhodanese-related sulfurtransferase